MALAAQTEVKGISYTTTASANLRGAGIVFATDPALVVTFATEEADAAYFLAITPTNFPAGASVTSIVKATTGFTITMAGLPNHGSAGFDWILIR